MSALFDKLEKYAKNSFNVMLIGTHGIGKSTVVKEISSRLDLKFKYYSSSTLDPWAELVGIPVPNREKNTVEFFRPSDLENAEFIFFDELNRAHPRVLNAVLEIVQFKTINGVPLKNLKMVWAAINPPGGDYQVEDLDPALIDRFHVYINMKPEVNMEYFKTKMPEEIARVLRTWWDTDLSDEQRKNLTPRRLEYIGTMVAADIPWRDALPPGQRFPTEELVSKLRVLNKEEEGFEWTKENILKDKNLVLGKLKESPKYAIKLSAIIGKFNHEELFEIRDIIELMPKELVKKSIGIKFPSNRQNLKKKLEDNNCDLSKYPKLMDAIIKGAKE